MRVVKHGMRDKGRKVEFECPHCESILRARECELTPYGIKDGRGNERMLIFYCPVCKSRRVIHRYSLIPVLKITDYISLALDNVVKDDLIYDDPDMEEIAYEH